MKRVYRRILWGLMILVTGVVLAGVAANAWLESSGGRQLLQNALQDSLGRPVRLEGDFGIRLLPRLRITGEGLQLGSVTGDAVVASSRRYAAAVELRPFLRGEIRIASISVQGGMLDLNAFLGEDRAPGAADSGAGGQWPSIASLELADFQLLLPGGTDRVVIQRLLLTDFRPGQNAGLQLQASWLQDQSESAAVSLDGVLTIHQQPMTVSLEVREMEFSYGRFGLQAVQGHFDLQETTSELQGQLSAMLDANRLTLAWQVRYADGLSGALQASHHASTVEIEDTLAAQFELRQQQLNVRGLRLSLGGQELDGAGCLQFGQAPRLSMELQAAELDLDALYARLPEQDTTGSDWPVELAVIVRIARAHGAGATATDVEVRVGDEPACGDAVPITP